MSQAPHGSAGHNAGAPTGHGYGRPAAEKVYQDRPGGGPPPKRQFVHFSFFKLDPAFRRLPIAEQSQMAAGLSELVDQNDRSKMILLTYSTVGTRGDTDFMFWKISWELDEIQKFSAAINRLPIAGYLQTPHSFLSQTKRSTYIDKLDPSHDESRTTIKPGKYKYVFVYPFVKSREWYLLHKTTRQGVMDEHIEIGNLYQSVRLNTTYSFGLDDQDFVVAFETEHPADFLDLVQALRETEGSKYTVRDTPIISCVQTPMREIMSQLAAV